TVHGNFLMDLGPGASPDQYRSPSPFDHARFAYAIVTSYAVLEQLGMDLRGEAFKDKKWIPDVRKELEERLQKKGVNLSETVVWHLRGGKSTLEKKRPPTIVRKAPWAYGLTRDCEVHVVDAVADLRWLRSGVSAHNMKAHARLLSIYDVSNAQRLAQ